MATPIVVTKTSGIDHTLIEAFVTITILKRTGENASTTDPTSATRYYGTIEWAYQSDTLILLHLKGGRSLEVSLKNQHLEIEVHKYLYT